MAHLPPNFLPASAEFSKIVFVCAGNPAAVLVQRRGRKMTEQPMEFVTPQAALTWCEKNSANLYFFQPADPARH